MLQILYKESKHSLLKFVVYRGQKVHNSTSVDIFVGTIAYFFLVDVPVGLTLERAIAVFCTDLLLVDISDDFGCFRFRGLQEGKVANILE